MPEVLNKRFSQDGVYIGRPTKWGNPYSITKTVNRFQAIQMYKDWIYQNPALMAGAKKELKGKNLVCFCAPLACHGDILLKIANDD